jgi:hypothetical protein
MSASFSSVRLQIEAYYAARLVQHMTPRGEHLLHELRGRLRRLEWIHSRLLDLEATLLQEARDHEPGEPPARLLLIFTETGRPNALTADMDLLQSSTSDELWVLLEAFYYSAHRVRDILRDNREDLPDLGGFEATGVRDVRNHLVEHPTRQSGVVVPSLKCGGPVGPQLKAVRFSPDPVGTFDAGLHENCREFLEALAVTLARATDASTRLST